MSVVCGSHSTLKVWMKSAHSTVRYCIVWPVSLSWCVLQDHLDDLLRQLIVLLASNDVTTVTCTAGVLCNLTCNNAKNKTIVCQLHGVQVCTCIQTLYCTHIQYRDRVLPSFTVEADITYANCSSEFSTNDIVRLHIYVYVHRSHTNCSSG